MERSASAGVNLVSISVSPIGISNRGTFRSIPKVALREPKTCSNLGESTTDLANMSTKKAMSSVPRSENVAIQGGAWLGQVSSSSTSGDEG